MKKLGIAIIGCGAISKNHGEAIKNSKVDLLYSVDLVNEKAEMFSKKYGGTPLTDYHEALRDPRVDVVHICTPHYNHAMIALDAMEFGKHVFCEKPIAINPEDAYKMTEKAEKNQCYLGVCFQNRLNNTAIAAKKVIDSKQYGPILSAMGRVAWDRHGSYYVDSSWRGQYETEGGGCIINQAIHTIDLLDYLCGGIEGVSAIAKRLRDTDDYEVDDSCMANFKLKNGNTAVGYFTNCYARGKIIEIEIVFENAKLILEQHRLRIITKDGTEIMNDKKAKGEKSEWGLSHGKLIQEFYHCIIEDRPFFIDGRSAIRSLLIVDAIKKSNGLPISIDSFR